MRRPILYSFRRCPYAMRARLAVWQAGIDVELREVRLRDKPPELLTLSPKGTVPVLHCADGTVLDESLDIARWALARHDPDGWLDVDPPAFAELEAAVTQGTGRFKTALDRYKYAERFPDHPRAHYRAEAVVFLHALERALEKHAQLLGPRITLADAMVFPFVRQFRGVDPVWFDAAPDLARVGRWLHGHLESDLFRRIMEKVPVYRP